MKQLIFLPLSLLFVFSSVQANEFRGAVENLYIKAANTLLFFTSENIISSGSYEFGSDNSTLNTHFFPVTHHFDSDSDFYNFYVNGSIGYSKYKEKNIDLRRGSSDDITIKTYALKLGGGIRLNILKDTDMMIGGSYIYSKVNSKYHASRPLVATNPIDKTMDHVFNSHNHFNTYEFSSSIGYHPTIHAYQPYVRADIHYFDTRVNDPYATISNTSSTIAKLKAGVTTPLPCIYWPTSSQN